LGFLRFVIGQGDGGVTDSGARRILHHTLNSGSKLRE